MTYDEALKELDDPAEGEDYGVKMMWSKSMDEFILKSRYGLCKCTHDWPSSFIPQAKHLEAIDYKIITSTSEAYS